MPGPLTISQMTALPTLAGTELFPVVSPGNNPALNANYTITTNLLASAVVGNLLGGPNQVLAGPPSGIATAAAVFRSLVLLDLPQGTTALPLVAAGAAQPNYQVLTVPGGGSGGTTFTAEGILYGRGTSALGVTAAGTTGLPLVGNGTALAPAFAVLSLAGGGLNTTTLTQFGITYGNGTNTIGITAAGTSLWPLLANGTALAPSFQQLSLATSVTGTLSVPFGGTGGTTFTAEGVLYGNGTAGLGVTAAGTTGWLLTGQGSATGPLFAILNLSTAPLTGILPAANMTPANLATSGPGGVVGNLPVGNLNSGAGAGTTTFWRGDGTWATSAGGGNVIGPSTSVINDIVTFNSTVGSIQDSGFTLQNAGAFYSVGAGVNLIRNAALDVWQRGILNLAIGTAGAYGPDGFIILPSGSGATALVSRAAGRQPTLYCAEVVGTTAVSDLKFKQRIESYIAARATNTTLTFQAQIALAAAGSVVPTLTISAATAVDTWTGTTILVNAVALQTCASSAWTQVGYTFNTTSQAANGLEITIDMGNNFATNTAFFKFTEVDLRVTPNVTVGLNSALPFPELRQVPTELALCQRYFETSYDQNIAPGTASSVLGTNPSIAFGTNFVAGARFEATKRADPAVTIYGPYTGAVGKIAPFNSTAELSATGIIATSSVVGSQISNVGFAQIGTSGSVFTGGQWYIYQWTASAEL